MGASLDLHVRVTVRVSRVRVSQDIDCDGIHLHNNYNSIKVISHKYIC